MANIITIIAAGYFESKRKRKKCKGMMIVAVMLTVTVEVKGAVAGQNLR
jgi:hypothetical protein